MILILELVQALDLEAPEHKGKRSVLMRALRSAYAEGAEDQDRTAKLTRAAIANPAEMARLETHLDRCEQKYKPPRPRE